ncbi:MAG: 5-(carboxyamino)imidazole ribonucleotide synthase [Crocinitomicaceae bacterium]
MNHNIGSPKFKVGVLGGGQLGRMLIQEAINFNIDIHILDVEGSPCSLVASHFKNGNIKDFEDVLNFGKDLDVLTIEIENVNIEALYELEKRGVKVYPQPKVIELIQDKGKQKEFYVVNNFPTAPYLLVNDLAETESNIDYIPFVQKLRTGGYDGKGVQTITSISDLEKGFDAPCVLEKFVDLEKELSVIVARNENGETMSFPVVEQEFNNEANLVEFLFSPADISSTIEETAQEIAKSIITKLDMVGLLAVEFFLSKTGELFVNEIAPRPHNSGHQTIEGNITSQFEQHLRSICGLPLGSTGIIKPSVMINLLGAKGYEGAAVYKGIHDILRIDGVYPHLYGKEMTKPFRKMGHITIVHNNLDKAKEIAHLVKETIQVISE